MNDWFEHQSEILSQKEVMRDFGITQADLDEMDDVEIDGPELVELVIKQVAGSMAIEGFVLSEEDKERIRRAAECPEDCEEIVQELIRKHTVADPFDDMPEPKILFNRARCRKCGSFLESKSVHDFQTCSCGAISIDGGLEYLHRAGEPADIEELSEGVMPIWDEDRQCWI